MVSDQGDGDIDGNDGNDENNDSDGDYFGNNFQPLKSRNGDFTDLFDIENHDDKRTMMTFK